MPSPHPSGALAEQTGVTLVESPSGMTGMRYGNFFWDRSKGSAGGMYYIDPTTGTETKLNVQDIKSTGGGTIKEMIQRAALAVDQSYRAAAQEANIEFGPLQEALQRFSATLKRDKSFAERAHLGDIIKGGLLVGGTILGGMALGGLLGGGAAGAGAAGAGAGAAGAGAAGSTIVGAGLGAIPAVATVVPGVGAAAGAGAAAAAGGGLLGTLGTIGDVASAVGTVGSLVTALTTPTPKIPTEGADVAAARAAGMEEMARADAALNAVRKRSQMGRYGARFFRTSAMDRLGNSLLLQRPGVPGGAGGTAPVNAGGGTPTAPIIRPTLPGRPGRGLRVLRP